MLINSFKFPLIEVKYTWVIFYMPTFLPKWYSKTIYDIEISKLKSLNVKFLLSDLDNTLVGYDVAEPSDRVHNLIENLKQNDIELIVVSNNNYKRLTKFCSNCNLKFLSSAKKPGAKRLLRFLNENSIDINNCAFVGDQLLTDMWCANKIGLTSILVEPLQKEESIFTFFNRKIDKVIRKRYTQEGKLNSIMKGE